MGKRKTFFEQLQKSFNFKKLNFYLHFNWNLSHVSISFRNVFKKTIILCFFFLLCFLFSFSKLAEISIFLVQRKLVNANFIIYFLKPLLTHYLTKSKLILLFTNSRVLETKQTISRILNLNFKLFFLGGKNKQITCFLILNF